MRRTLNDERGSVQLKKLLRRVRRPCGCLDLRLEEWRLCGS